MDTKCNVHIEKSLDLFCKTCSALICTRCLKDHQGKCETMDCEDYFEEIKGKASKVLEPVDKLIEDANNEKETETSTFQRLIKEKYEQELEYLSKTLGEIHDTLHVKEVELKRELKSHYDDNTEIYLQNISLIEEKIGNLEQSKNGLQISDKPKQTDILGYIKSYSTLLQMNNDKENIVTKTILISQTCGSCSKDVTKSFYFCRACVLVICAQCKPITSHHHKLYESEDIDYNCDICGVKLKKERYSCNQCKASYDLCSECFQKHSHQPHDFKLLLPKDMYSLHQNKGNPYFERGIDRSILTQFKTSIENIQLK